LPERVYVIMGDSFRATPDPPYVTDPRHYGLPIFKEPVSDRQYDRYYRERIKAFLDREDAVKFAYSCNLMTVRCPVFDRASAGWVLNEGETGALAEDLT
jgi:hypothetical protein